MTKGTAYDFRVTAKAFEGVVGDTPATVQHTAVFAPSAPTIDTSSGLKQESNDYTLTWTKPDDGGATIDQYKVYFTN